MEKELIDAGGVSEAFCKFGKMLFGLTRCGIVLPIKSDNIAGAKDGSCT